MADFHALAIHISEADMLPCLSKQLLELECPGCGLQRSAALLLNGQLTASFLMYPGLYPMMLFLAFAALDRFAGFRHGPRITSALGLLTAGTILINFLLKIIN